MRRPRFFSHRFFSHRFFSHRFFRHGTGHNLSAQRRFVLLLPGLMLGMLIICSWMRVALAQSETVASLAEYTHALEAAAAILQEPGDEPTPAERYARARSTLEFDRITLTSGEEVALQPLLPPIASNAISNATVASALTRLQTVQAQLAASTQDETATRLALLQAIWERPEFTASDTWWQRFQRWLREQIGRLLALLNLGTGPVGGLGIFGGFLGQIVVWLVMLGAVAAIVWLLSTWLRGLFSGMVSDASLRGTTDDGLPLTAGAARQQAGELAGVGNYRQAVRQLYLAALLTLEERNLLRHDRSLTNRELLQSLHDTVTGEASSTPATEYPEQADRLASIESHLQPVINTFDAVWYGEREPDQQTFEQYAHQLDQLDRTLDESGYTRAGTR